MTLDTLIHGPTIPLNDPNLNTYLQAKVCNVGNPVGYTYTGCGILFGGFLLDIILCLILRGGNRENM